MLAGRFNSIIVFYSKLFLAHKFHQFQVIYLNLLINCTFVSHYNQQCKLIWVDWVLTIFLDSVKHSQSLKKNCHWLHLIAFIEVQLSLPKRSTSLCCYTLAEVLHRQHHLSLGSGVWSGTFSWLFLWTPYKVWAKKPLFGHDCCILVVIYEGFISTFYTTQLITSGCWNEHNFEAHFIRILLLLFI